MSNSRKPFKYIALGLLGFLLCPAIFAQGDGGLSEKRDGINRLTTQLKVASFRGDMVRMKEHYEGILAALPKKNDDPSIGSLCNFNCHLQLASYHLFRASNYPYLLSKSSQDNPEVTAAASPDAVKKEADAGIKLIDRGLSYLYRQQTVVKDDGERAFREFTRQAALLNTMKVRLYMVAGDAWYQSVSQAQVQYMDKLIDKAAGGKTDGKPSELGYANAYYEQASWSLVELQGDVPAAGPEFDPIRQDLLVLNRELATRLESVRKGFLFLNIDPEAMTSITVAELQTYLKNLYDKVQDAEVKLDAMVSEYSDKILKQDIAAIDQSRLVNSKSMDLSLHKIAGLEAQAEKMQAEYARQIGVLTGALDTSETRRQLREIELNLQKKLLEYEAESKLISLRSDQDLLAMSKEANEERRQELRWLIDHSIAVMNLDLQVKSFELQLSEYQRQRSNNNKEMEQIQFRIAQRQSSIAAERAGISGAQTEIQRLNQQKGEVFAARLSVFETQVQGMMSQINALNTIKDKKTEVCTWRQSVATKLGEDYDKIMKCMKGGDCEGEISRVESIKALKESEVEAIKAQRDNILKVIDSMSKQVSLINEARVAYNTAKVVTEAMLIPMEAAVTIAKAVPRVTVAVGLTGYVATEYDPAAALEATYTAARRVQEAGMDIIKFNIDLDKELLAIATQVQEQLNRYNELTHEEGIKKAAAQVSLSQLMGEYLDAKIRKNQNDFDAETTAKECEREFAELAKESLVLSSEIDRINQEKNWETKQNNLLDAEIQKQKDLIAQGQANIDRLAAEQEELKVLKSQLVSDNAAIDNLERQVNKSIDRVTSTQSEVEGMAQDSKKLTGVITDLQDQMRLKALSIRDEELKGLEAALKEDKAAASEKMKSLSETLQTQLKMNALKEQMANAQEEYAKIIADERNNVIKQAQKDIEVEIDNQNEQKRLVFASEESLATITAGLPNFIDTKRRSLESANFAINLMRNRVQAIQAASVQPQSIDAPQSYYLRSGADFVNAMTDLCNGEISGCVGGRGLFFDERQVNVVGSVITVPRNSTLFRTLQEKGRANFKIVPRQLTREQQDENGYFELGIPDMNDADGFNASLLDIKIASNCKVGSTPQIGVRHQGVGTWFKKYQEFDGLFLPEVTSKGERFFVTDLESFDQPIYGGKIGFENAIKYSNLGTVRVRDFDEKLKDSSIRPNYLGWPLFGRYELVEQSGPCLEAASELVIGLTYTKSIVQ